MSGAAARSRAPRRVRGYAAGAASRYFPASLAAARDSLQASVNIIRSL